MGTEDKKTVKGSSVRDKLTQAYFTEAEEERVQWAAKELGLTRASFVRMASLKMAKEVVG